MSLSAKTQIHLLIFIWYLWETPPRVVGTDAGSPASAFPVPVGFRAGRVLKLIGRRVYQGPGPGVLFPGPVRPLDAGLRSSGGSAETVLASSWARGRTFTGSAPGAGGDRKPLAAGSTVASHGGTGRRRSPSRGRLPGPAALGLRPPGPSLEGRLGLPGTSSVKEQEEARVPRPSLGLPSLGLRVRSLCPPPAGEAARCHVAWAVHCFPRAGEEGERSFRFTPRPAEQTACGPAASARGICDGPGGSSSPLKTPPQRWFAAPVGGQKVTQAKKCPCDEMPRRDPCWVVGILSKHTR